ncbi:MAG: response regulator, partial [Deltaproteobacteria bacterium]|nr:response regulator [Deltaproteobacteria bacterium]
VVQLVLTKAGYTVVTAADGDDGIEVAREKRPDVILLDFVMPKMNGYQVCRALHQEPELADIPVVLMSAKGDQVGDRFVKVMGIVDFVTKPFSPDAITKVVKGALEKRRQSTVEEESVTAMLPDLAPDAVHNAADAERSAQQAALDAFRDALAAKIGETLTNEVKARGVDLDADEAGKWVVASLHDDALRAILGDLRGQAPELAGASDATLTGTIAGVPLAEVLTLIAQQEQTGLLTVTRGEAQVDLHFRRGDVAMATAAGVSDEYLIGRFILKDELMSKTDLDLFLKSRSGSTKLLGHQLIKLGYVSAANLKEVLRKQTTELIYEMMRWKEGRFTFRPAETSSALGAAAALGLSIDEVLLEGYRRVDEWHLIELEVENLDQVFLRNEEALAQLGRGRLSREELAVLELVNGKKTVKDVVRSSRMGTFEVSRMLYRLLAVKLVRKRVAPVAV